MLDYEVVCRCYDKWNGRVPTIKRDIELNINIWFLRIPSWWVTILSPYLCIFKLDTMHYIFCEFHYLLWTTLFVRLQLHSSSTSNRVFLWVHILMVKVCKNTSQVFWIYTLNKYGWWGFPWCRHGIEGQWCLEYLWWCTCHCIFVSMWNSNYINTQGKGPCCA